VPPIPVVPTPMSPAGMLMIGALGLALLFALRRIGKLGA
jgi:MYXO-CTERM domain-containing protein